MKNSGVSNGFPGKKRLSLLSVILLLISGSAAKAAPTKIPLNEPSFEGLDTEGMNDYYSERVVGGGAIGNLFSPEIVDDNFHSGLKSLKLSYDGFVENGKVGYVNVCRDFNGDELAQLIPGSHYILSAFTNRSATSPTSGVMCVKINEGGYICEESSHEESTNWMQMSVNFETVSDIRSFRYCLGAPNTQL